MLGECVLGGVDFADPDFEAAASRLQRAHAKRALDILVSVFGLVFLAPFFALISILIFIDNPGPVLFCQRRTGYDGVPFVIYKFRSMRVLEDGPNVLAAERDDTRTTSLGHFLRRSSIDELPQLLNVLKGEMSLVGPRPHAVVHDEYYAHRIPGYQLRFKAKPGITGLAQISGFRGGAAHDGHMIDRVAHDTKYIRNWSFVLDIQILFRTMVVVPFDSAAY